MKICFATNYLPGYHKTWGGAEQASLTALELLVKEGQHVDVLTTKLISNPQGNEGFNIFPIPVLEDYSLVKKIARGFKSWLPFDFVSYVSAVKALKKLQPNVLHLHNFDVLSFSMIASARKLNIPIVLSIYDYWYFCPRRTLLKAEGEICREFHGPFCTDCLGLKKSDYLRRQFLRFRKRFFNWFLNKVNAFIVLSKSSAGILEEYGVDKEKIHVVRLPLWEEVKPSKPDNLKRNAILFIGWLYPHKGLHVFLKAMPQILKEVPDAELYVIETGKEKVYGEKMEELIKELKLEKHVNLVGKVSHDEVEKFLQKTGVVVIPEQWENMSPLVLAESMIFGKPVVASRIGGIPEFIEDAQSGFLVAPGDSYDFAKKVIWLLQNKQEAREMGKKAQETAYRLFSEEKFFDDLLGLYKKLIS